jgi:hypothetical protein
MKILLLKGDWIEVLIIGRAKIAFKMPIFNLKTEI